MNGQMRVIVFSVLCLSIPCWAIDFMGPPTATLQPGQWRPDFTYHYSENDVELTDISSPVEIGRIDLHELKLNRYYSTVDYGVTERWEVYGKAGAGSIESGDTDFAYGWGTRLTAVDGDTIDWGVGFLMSWLEPDDEDSHLVCIEGQVHRGRFDFDIYEMQVMAGPTISFDGWKLYGGVFYYELRGDFDGMVTGPLLTGRISGDVDEESNVGGYTGVILGDLGGTSLMIETAFLDGGWGIGGNIWWGF